MRSVTHELLIDRDLTVLFEDNTLCVAQMRKDTSKATEPNTLPQSSSHSAKSLKRKRKLIFDHVIMWQIGMHRLRD